MNMNQEQWSFNSDLSIESSWLGASHLNSSDFVHKKIGIKIKAYVKKLFLNSTRVKLRMVTKAHNFNNSLYSTIIFDPANYG